MTPTLTRDTMILTFRAPFGLDDYRLFVQAKQLPELTCAYDVQADTYTLTTPARFAHLLGVALPPAPAASLPLAPHLWDYQQAIVRQALEAKRYAIWADTGLGKTAMFLEWARQVIHRTQGRVLVLSPLQIIEQTEDECRRFYGVSRFEWPPTRQALAAWCAKSGPGLAICNYEKLTEGELPELRHLAGLVADESGLLRTGGGVIKWNLIKSAKGIPFKLSCTATPAPNDSMEFASQASFLEKLRSEGEVLWTFFRRDKRGEWTIKPYAREGFYRFLASWSIYLRNPARFGWTDVLAALPPPKIEEYTLAATPEQQAAAQRLFVEQGAGLFGLERLGITVRSKLSQIAKGFLYSRQQEATRIPANKPGFVADLAYDELRAGRQVLVWTVFDEESAILAEALAARGCAPAALHGSLPMDVRGNILHAFKAGDIPVLISKAELLGYGLNLQNCSSMIFSGMSDSFADFYQAIRRCYRPGQTATVHVHIPYIPFLEGMILDNVQQKQARFDAEAALHEQHYLAAMRDLGGVA